MATPNVDLFSKDARVTLNGISETWTIVTTAGTGEGTHNLQTDTIMAEVINMASYNGSALTGEARAALIAGETANSGTYHFLASGKGIVINTTGKTTRALYYKRDAGVNITLLIRELRA